MEVATEQAYTHLSETLAALGVDAAELYELARKGDDDA